MTSPERGTPRSLKQLESLESMEGIVQAEHSAPSSRSLLHRLPKGALVHAVYPGVLVAVTIALASSWLSQHYGAPVLLLSPIPI